MRGRAALLLAVALTVPVGAHAAVATPAAAPPPAVAPAPLAERLDALFRRLHAEGSFAGAVVVGRRGESVWEGGYGWANRQLGAPFTVDTPADGASLAKTMTAALVLLLEHEGRLALDAPAARLLPELPYGDVTLRHLLSHSAGLPDYPWFDDHLGPGEVRTTERLLGALATRRPALAFAPGSAFEYNSLGFDLAALAAARAAQRPTAELFAERLFRPLGLASAFLRPGRLGDFPAPRTVGYGAGGSLHEVFDLEAFHGGSNVYLSARDLHRWSSAFLDRPPLPPAALAAALTPARVGAGTSGLTLGSWYRDGAGAYWYSGHLAGFHSEAFRDTTSGWSIVYHSNVTLDPWLQKGIVRAVRAVLAGGPAGAFGPPPGLAAFAAEEQAALAGTWSSAEGQQVRLAHDERGLRAVEAGVEYRAFPVGPAAFYVPGLDWTFGFARGGSGRPPRLYLSTHGEGSWKERQP